MNESHWVKQAEDAIARSKEASHDAESAALHLATAQVYATLSNTEQLVNVVGMLDSACARLDTIDNSLADGLDLARRVAG